MQRRIAYQIVIALLLFTSQYSLARDPWPADFLDDADLHDVHFVDADQGWAVGDRGLILHTLDGGTTWNVQPTPVGDSLHSVDFLDAQRGWAVGGSAVPYTDRGRGVILRTDNGGRTWFVEKVRTLPVLREVRFFDTQQGVVIGDASALYPAGAFSTRDGGRTWNPYPVRTAHGWTAADFRPSGRGLLLAAAGHITTCDGANCRARSTPRLRSGSMRDIAWIDDDRAIAVGDQGTVWISQNRGTHWKDASQNMAATDANATLANLHTVTTEGTNLWVAGTTSHSKPSVYRSTNGGQSWQAISIPHQTPLSQIAFDASSGRGWAVGPLGSILQSSNRGETWKTIRGKNRRLFALAVFENVKDVPWSLLAQVAGDYGGRSRVFVVNNEPRASLSMSASGRVHQAALAVGANGGESLRAKVAVEEVARAIRDWNPSMLIVGGSDSFVDTANSATKQASQPLAVWRASLEPTKKPGGITVFESETASSLGATFAQLNAEALSIVGQHRSENLVVRCLPLGGHVANGDRITNGHNFNPGSPARRASLTAGENRRSLQHAAQQYTLLQQLIRRAVADPNRGKVWLAQAENMTNRLPASSAAKILYELARQQFATGDVPSSLTTLDAITARYTTSDIHDAALRDAVLWTASREVAHFTSAATTTELADGGDTKVKPATYKFDPAAAPRIQEPVRRDEEIPIDRLINTGQTIADALQAAPTPAQQLLAEKAAYADDNPVRTASHSMVMGPSRGITLATWLERVGPEHRADPDLQLAIESHRRRVAKPGLHQSAVFQRLARTLPGAWRDCASAELALLKPERDAVKPVVSARFGKRPHLDGKLSTDEGTWPDLVSPHASKSSAILLPLEPAAIGAEQSAPAAIAMLAADDKFLYIAIRCQQQPGADYQFDSSPRTRDADLSNRDRIDFWIDTDRDYSVAWRLTVDHRGWTGESLSSNTAWNPQWFVAAPQPDAAPAREWICEAAIAWSELGESHPTASDPWALKVTRTLPNGQRQHWPPTSVQAKNLEDAGLFHFAK